MALTHGNLARNNMCDGTDDAVNNGTGTAVLVWMQGTTDVVTFNLQDPAFNAGGAVTTGAMTLQGLTLTATAATAGTPTKFEMRSKNGTAQILGTIGTSGNDLVLDNTNIAKSQTCKQTSFQWSAPS